ncbi:uncharacterized protein naf1 [Spinachia spinachia]
MDESLPEQNGRTTAANNNKREEEEMEGTMTSQLESLILPPSSAVTSSNTQTPTDEKIDAMLSVEPLCQTEDEDSDSDSSSSSASSSVSPTIPIFEDEDDEIFSQPAPIKTRDEVLLEELPAVEELSVSLPEDAELQPIGTISSIIQQLVVIQSLKDTPPLTDDSVIFTSDRLALGKVFEVFGPVSSPLYILRFNSVDQITNKGLAEGKTVYYTPGIKEYTSYILTQRLKVFKGSDASWKNDQEPPVEALDYSDDEKEQEAKKKMKYSRKKRDNSNAGNPGHITQNVVLQQRDVRGFQPRHSGPPSWHQDPRNIHPQFRHANPHPMYPPPPCPYPPPPSHFFPPPNLPLYPPPPPSSFFNPSFPCPQWPPKSVPFADLPPPPPPPPQ